MTSSFRLKKRFDAAETWSFGSSDAPLGGWEDHYLRPWGDCHPDFMAIPISNPDGTKVCVRRNAYGTKKNFETEQKKQEAQRENFLDTNGGLNGYHKFSLNLYDPTAKKPTQLYNPYRYEDRVPPNEAYNIRNDLIRNEIKYEGTGCVGVTTPLGRESDGDLAAPFPKQLNPEKRKGFYLEYGYDIIKPPPRYDVSRLHQPYEFWRKRQIQRGIDTSQSDKNNWQGISYI